MSLGQANLGQAYLDRGNSGQMISPRLTSILRTMFWEVWQLSYRRFTIRVAAALAACALLMTFSENDQLVVAVIVLAAVIQGPFPAMAASSAEDQGGFPFRLSFVRPVPSWLMVGLPMIYYGALCGLSYLIPILILSLVADIEPYLLPATATIVTIALVFAAMQWWTDSKTLRFAAWTTLILLFGMVVNRLEQAAGPGEEMFYYTAMTYGILFLIGTVALGLAIWGVESQRRGENRFASSGKLVATIRTLFEGDMNGALASIGGGLGAVCPTSSPLKAEMWRVFTSQASAMLVLTALAAVSVLMVWIFDVGPEREMFALGALLGLVMLFHLAFRDVYGVRSRNGKKYISPFDATLAMSSAQLIGLRVLVSVTGILFGMLLYLAIVFFFGFFISEDIGAIWQWMTSYFRSTSLTTNIAWTVFGFVQLAAMGVCLASVAVFFSVIRRPITSRQKLVAIFICAGLLVYGFLNHEAGHLGNTIVVVVIPVIRVLSLLIFLTTINLFRSVLKQRLLTRATAILAVLLWFAYGGMFLYMGQKLLQRDEIVLIQMNTELAVILAAFCLLPLTAFVWSPWAYSRIRHL